MELEDKIYLSARMTIHEYLITSWYESMLAPVDVPEETLRTVGAKLREGIAFRTIVPSDTSRDAPTLEIQTETLRQFDELWAKISAKVTAARAKQEQGLR